MFTLSATDRILWGTGDVAGKGKKRTCLASSRSNPRSIKKRKAEREGPLGWGDSAQSLGALASDGTPAGGLQWRIVWGWSKEKPDF
jgi:hypothetical protein